RPEDRGGRDICECGGKGIFRDRGDAVCYRTRSAQRRDRRRLLHSESGCGSTLLSEAKCDGPIASPDAERVWRSRPESAYLPGGGDREGLEVFHAGAGEGADRVSSDLGAPGSETGRPLSGDARPQQGGGRGSAAYGDRRGGAHGAVKR